MNPVLPEQPLCLLYQSLLVVLPLTAAPCSRLMNDIDVVFLCLIIDAAANCHMVVNLHNTGKMREDICKIVSPYNCNHRLSLTFFRILRMEQVSVVERPAKRHDGCGQHWIHVVCCIACCCARIALGSSCLLWFACLRWQ